jgi:hypothetical protein
MARSTVKGPSVCWCDALPAHVVGTPWWHRGVPSLETVIGGFVTLRSHPGNIADVLVRNIERATVGEFEVEPQFTRDGIARECRMESIGIILNVWPVYWLGKLVRRIAVGQLEMYRKK